MILVGSAFWSGLVDWFKDRLVAEGTIHPNDLNLFSVVDDADAVVEAIEQFYQGRSYSPTTEELEKLRRL